MKKIFLFIFPVFFVVSCKEFIEPSISSRTVRLMAPADSTESGSYGQTFWWEEVNDALSYRLQIVSPSFDKPARLLIDTVLRTNKFTTTLEPGTFQWRVMAENGSSKSAFSSAVLFVFSSALGNQQVQLKSPLNGYVTNGANQLYSWEKVYGASGYRLQIDTANFADESKLVFNNAISGLQQQVPFPSEGVYRWRVRAESDTSSSKWSSAYMVTFDKTPPAKVALLAPSDKLVTQKQVDLQWTALSDAGIYELYVYKNDSVTLYSTGFPVRQAATSYTLDGIQGEKLYWKVRASDKVGNNGEFSELRSFTIQ